MSHLIWISRRGRFIKSVNCILNAAVYWRTNQNCLLIIQSESPDLWQVFRNEIRQILYLSDKFFKCPIYTNVIKWFLKYIFHVGRAIIIWYNLYDYLVKYTGTVLKSKIHGPWKYTVVVKYTVVDWKYMVIDEKYTVQRENYTARNTWSKQRLKIYGLLGRKIFGPQNRIF